MLTMSQINEIREAFQSGKKVSQIAREFEVDEKTVRKYLKQQDFSPTMPVAEERESKLDPYKAQIQEWLDGDANVWYKQRHTALASMTASKRNMRTSTCRIRRCNGL